MRLRAVVAAAAVSVSLLTVPASAGTHDYSYYGTSTGIRSLRLSLDTATIRDRSSHVAAWLGASTQDASAWVQAGVADEGAGPCVYIEFQRPGSTPYIVMWPTEYGHRVRVTLAVHLNRWHVTVAHHVSRSVLLPDAFLVSTLEILGDASGSATIGQRAVVSP